MFACHRLPLKATLEVANQPSFTTSSSVKMLRFVTCIVVKVFTPWYFFKETCTGEQYVIIMFWDSHFFQTDLCAELFNILGHL